MGKLAWLKTSVLLWLGAISYTLYLTHQTIGYALLEQLFKAGLKGWPALVITAAALLGLASILTYWVERPALKAIRAAWRNRKETALTPKSAH
jgi:peptidoglycan/LPS O-acetylase OafA/YrhL